ncbi:D-alanyl-D-alanine dipeptidase, partial [Mesorhizobium sp. M7A.F.Ca.ET.027.03.2.1]
MSALEHPPLSCRTSPPQGGRLAARAPRPFVTIGDWRSHMRHPISPLEGEMSGRT